MSKRAFRSLDSQTGKGASTNGSRARGASHARYHRRGREFGAPFATILVFYSINCA